MVANPLRVNTKPLYVVTHSAQTGSKPCSHTANSPESPESPLASNVNFESFVNQFESFVNQADFSTLYDHAIKMISSLGQSHWSINGLKLVAEKLRELSLNDSSLQNKMQVLEKLLPGRN